MINFIEISGTSYDIGKQSGQVLKESIMKQAKEYEQYLKNSGIYKSMKIIEQKVIDTFPTYYSELCGRADGAGVSRDALFLSLCYELMDVKTGCSSIMYRKPDGSWLLSHNEDDSIATEEFFISKVNLGDSWFSCLDTNTTLFGGAFSWNSDGIVITINHCHPKEFNILGIPRSFAWRHILEAKSIDDLIERCSMPDRASGYHINAIDINKNEALSIEISHKAVSVKKVKDYNVHTNHYIHGKITKGRFYVNPKSNSFFRLNKVTDLLEKLIKSKKRIIIEDLRKILSYRGRGYEDSILILPEDGYSTVANFSFDSAAKEISIHFWLTDETYTINYFQ